MSVAQFNSSSLNFFHFVVSYLTHNVEEVAWSKTKQRSMVKLDINIAICLK